MTTIYFIMNAEHDVRRARRLILRSLHRTPESDALLSSFYKWDQCSEKLILLTGCSKTSKWMHVTLRSRSFHFIIPLPPCQPATKELMSWRILPVWVLSSRPYNFKTSPPQEQMLKAAVGCPAWRRAQEPRESRNLVFSSNYLSQEYIKS